MKKLFYPIDEFGAEALNEWWMAEGRGIKETEFPEEEFSKLEFSVFHPWAFDNFEIDIDEYEEDVIPFECIDDFLNRIEELKLDVPIFIEALESAKEWGGIVVCWC